MMTDHHGIATGRDDPALVARWTMRLTIFWAAFVHAHYVGVHAFGVGVVLAVVIEWLATAARTRRSYVALLAYALLCIWIVIGFGMVSGFWNHVVKLLVAGIHGGAVPPGLASLFKVPGVKSAAVEVGGCLTFVSACIAVRAVWRHVIALLRLRAAASQRTASSTCGST